MFFVFFFQAEDGIRDIGVTGVQTCALPICKAQHGRLGVTVQDLNQSLAESFGLQRPDGALIANVAPDSAAAKAGLKTGDVVTQVNGEAIVRSGALSSIIGMSAPGEKVKLKVWRDKAWRDIEVTLGSADAGKQIAR